MTVSIGSDRQIWGRRLSDALIGRGSKTRKEFDGRGIKVNQRLCSVNTDSATKRIGSSLIKPLTGAYTDTQYRLFSAKPDH